MANWMASAVKHPGAFSAKAKRSGMSTAAYAKSKASAPGTLGRQARLALTFAKFRPKKKTGSLATHLAAHRDTFRK